MGYNFKKVTCSVVTLLLLFVCHSVVYSQQVSRTVNYNAIFQPFGEGIHKEYLLPAEVDPEEHFQIRVSFDLTPEDITAGVTGTITFDPENGTLQIRGRDGSLRSEGGIRLQGVIDIAFELEIIPFLIVDPVLLTATLILDAVIDLPSIPIAAEVPIPGFPQINETWHAPQQFESLLLNGESVEVRGGLRKLARVELQAKDIVEAITRATTASAGVPLPPIAINAIGVVFEKGLGNAAVSCNLGFLSTATLTGKSITVNGQQITSEDQIISAPGLDLSQNTYTVNSSYEERFTYQLAFVVSSDVWLEFNPLGIPVWSYPETVIIQKETPIIEKQEVDLNFTSAQTIFPIVRAETAELPVAVNTIPTQNLIENGPSRPVDVAPYFSSQRTLTYTAESSNPTVATAQRVGSQITISPWSIGTTTITVTATDPDDLSAIQTIPVTVRSNSATIVRPPSDPTFTLPTTSNPIVEGLGDDVAVIVQNTEGQALNIRSNPWVDNNNNNKIGSVHDGATGTITDGPQRNGGFIWWKIDWDRENKQGWSVEAFEGSQLLFSIPPDLEVQFNVSDDEVKPGEAFTLEATVRNNGPGESAATEIFFYYQKSGENTPRVAGSGKFNVPSLQERGRHEESLRVEAPMAPGDYEYGAILPPDIPDTYDEDLVDPTGRIRLNNTDNESVEVTSSPDLIVESISANKSTVDPGEAFRLEVVVRNQGIGEPARKATLQYYRSSDANISKSDTEVGDDTISSSNLDTNDTAERSENITAPIEPGVYYYGACVDLRYESNTRNNCSSAVAITVRETGPPDLVVSIPTLSVNTLAPGQSFTLETTVRNQGIGPAPATVLQGYRSSNANISNVDTEVGAVDIGFLRPGNTQTARISLTAPVAAGTHYYGICVESVSNESNTVNNCSVGVTLTVENLAPVAVGTFPAQTLVVGTASVVDVAPYFSDSNQDTLSYKPSSSSLEIVAVEMLGLSDSHLRMNPLAAGTATVTVEATDPSGLTFSQAFSATVNPPPNRAPVALGTIPPETLMARGISRVVDVSGIFHDIDGDTLRYTAISDNTGVVSVTLSGTRITLIPEGEGSASVTVTASDGELSASLSIAVSITPYVDVEAWMPDANLRAAVRTALGLQPNDVLTQQMMAELTVLSAASNAAGTGVQDITGLEHATQLTRLDLGRTGVRDLTPLQDLTHLTHLTLWYTEISDLTPLQGLTNLVHLNLHQTTPRGISPLQGLINLTYLDIGRTQIRDLTPLSGLTALTSLNLSFNNANNFNTPGDLTPLSRLTTLTSLNLGHTSISDITPLKDLTALTHLDLKNNQISDISPVSGLTNLIQLYLEGNQISDVSPLEGLTSLRFLRLQYNPIADVAPLRRLKANNPSVNIDVDIEVQAPDLRVESVSVNKTTIAPGETFRLDAVVKNQGKADASAITVRYYQSTDDTISTTDTELKTATLGLIAVDGMREPWAQLTAPDTPGVYYYGVCIDAAEHETDTTNNCSIGVTVTVGSTDLVVESVSLNKTSVAPGETFQLNAVVKNQGAADASAITVRYYQSTDDTISATDAELSTATLGVIAVDGTNEPSVQLTAPDTPGIYYYGVCVDGVAHENDTTNNCSLAVAITVGGVDLVIDSVRASQSIVNPSENFRVTAVVRNQGEIASTSTVVRYYLSTDENISTADTEVNTATLPIVAGDTTSEPSAQFTAPDTPGTYYYGICIDAIASETDTTNNCSLAVAITVEGADLMIVGTPQVSKTTVALGETFQIETRIWNQGKAASSPTTLRYYLSTDDTISPEDTEVASDRVDSLSGRGASANRRRADLSKTLTAPDTAGVHYYGVCVDSVAGDANTLNNCSQAIAITVEAPPPEPVVSQVPGEPENIEAVEIQGTDLIISTVRVDASTIKLGGGVRLHITLTNQGTNAAPATKIRYYRSLDATISAEDTELRAVPVGGLGAGQSYTTWALLPSSFSLGVYYYGACLDAVESEFDTTNNCSDAVEIVMVLQSDPITGLEPRGRIPTQTLEVGDSPESLSISQYFAGKVETWETSSRKTDVVAVSMEADSDVVKLTPVSEGHSVVTVTARHGDSAAQQTFDVYVGVDPTLVLRWVIPIPPQPLAVGGSPLVLDVSRHVENEVERWRAVSSHPAVVVVSLSGSKVTLTPVSEGNAEVTIHASGGTSEVEHTFRVFVGAAGAPDLKWVIPVPPQTLVVGGSPLVLDVSGHVAGEVETWQARSSHETAVLASLSGSVVTLTPVSEGSSEVTISARRGDLEVSGTFTVAVGAADGLEWGVPIPPQTLEVGGSPLVLDVSGHVAGEVETWQASSSHEAFVAVSLSGSVVTLTPVSAGSSEVTISARRGDLTAESTFAVSVAPDSSPLVSIPDANLRAAVRSALGLAEGDTLTQQKMQKLTHIGAPTRGITNLTGLEHAVRLTSLYMPQNQISDITPLANLTNLTGLLILGENQISDISSLANLTGLTGLGLYQNQISDITPLAGLTGLTQLHISQNQISDITPLAGLTSLQELHLISNPISGDLAPIANLTALTRLSLHSDQISDISPLANLTALTRLYLYSDQISDISPLANLTALTHLQVINTHRISDISLIANLTALMSLSLHGNQIVDITPLANLTALTGLGLHQNQIVDITSLANLTSLTYLRLENNEISDVSPLENLTALTRLFLERNSIADLAPLRRLKEKNPSISIDIDINADLNNVQGAPTASVLPAETALLPNYPNPFNPETWIPYQLAEATDVVLTIYDVRGVVVRRLALGHRLAGFYRSRGRAAHWDSRNQLGEKVATGLYFYTLTADEFTTTGKMLIQK